MVERADFLEQKLKMSGRDNNPIITDEELIELYDIYQKMYNESDCRFYRLGVMCFQNSILSVIRARGLSV